MSMGYRQIVFSFAFACICSHALGSSNSNSVATDPIRNQSIAIGGRIGCDPLVPEYCVLPFPSDHWRDNTTGLLAFTKQSFPVASSSLGGGDKIIDPAAWNTLDGFSPAPSIITFIRGITDEVLLASGAPRLWDIARSLDDDSPTALIDASTGERVAHWVELDHASDTNRTSPVYDDGRALLLWPASRLDNSKRYIVSIGGDILGSVCQIGDHFRALLRDDDDGTSLPPARAAHFETAVFPLLVAAGVARESLCLAWDFTTMSQSSIATRMVSARDDAMEKLKSSMGDNSTKHFSITSVTDDFSEHIYRRVLGEFSVPLYLNQRKPGRDVRLLVNSSDGTVESNGWGKFAFEMLIPRSTFAGNVSNATVMQYGHGLFGNFQEVESSYLQEDSDRYGYVMVASTWLGLAEQDAPSVALLMAEDLADFVMIPERLTQGVVNALSLMRIVRDEMQDDAIMLCADGQTPLIDPTSNNSAVYFGNSDGGIMGTVYMALSQDVKRGLLGVAGTPFSLLLPRSVDFAQLFYIIKVRYRDPTDRITLLALLDLVWTRSQPAGFADTLRDDAPEPLPSTPKHQVMLHYGLGDAQVTWLGAHFEARSFGASTYVSNVKEGNETLFGFGLWEDGDVVTGQNAMIGFDFGAPTAPFVNLPPDEASDTHELPRRDSRAQDMMARFLATGEVANTCGGPCD